MKFAALRGRVGAILAAAAGDGKLRITGIGER